jgi:acyl carrier protein|tara:strand:+ start:440 stop:679 length:240 start_codon:yes stop_codon:yes gene_type:complete
MKIDLKFIQMVIKSSLNLKNYKLNLNSKFEKIPKWDSLGYMKMISEIESRLKLNIDIDEIVEANTVINLIEILNKKLKK